MSETSARYQKYISTNQYGESYIDSTKLDEQDPDIKPLIRQLTHNWGTLRSALSADDISQGHGLDLEPVIKEKTALFNSYDQMLLDKFGVDYFYLQALVQLQNDQLFGAITKQDEI